jgi:3-oxoacyl-[acyl-carrier protein] reductase
MTRHALIVGGARGIGAAIAADILAQGLTVTIAGRRSRSPTLEAAGAAWRAVDASIPEQARTLIADCAPIDILVVAAGPYHRTPLLKETDAGWREMFAGNLDTVFYLTQAVLPGMKARGFGRILTFSMANADKLQANPMVTGHYIAKIGVLVLTRTLAKAGAGHGVTANCISPGFIDSGSAPPEELEMMRPKIPARRIGVLDDVVSAARYLLSDEAGYVNGANLHISGAWGV